MKGNGYSVNLPSSSFTSWTAVYNQSSQIYVLDTAKLTVMLLVQNEVEARARSGTYASSFKGIEVILQFLFSKILGSGTIINLLTFKWVHLSNELSNKSLLKWSLCLDAIILYLGHKSWGEK